MRIQYVSDLHLEGSTIELQNSNSANLLILAGDITTSKSYKTHFDFFKNCSDSFERVVHICGNHEYYRGDIEETQQELFEFFYRNFKNIHSLQNESIDLGSHRLFGSTLWTDGNNGDPFTEKILTSGMNDFRLIQWKSRQSWKFRVKDMIELHQQSVSSLIRCLDDSEKPVIVVTHHAPSNKSVDVKYEADYHMNGGYRSDLEWVMENYASNLPLWFHGHMHDSVDYTLGKTRVLSNPRGYMISGRDGKRYTENESFDPNKTIDL